MGADRVRRLVCEGHGDIRVGQRRGRNRGVGRDHGLILIREWVGRELKEHGAGRRGCLTRRMTGKGIPANRKPAKSRLDLLNQGTRKGGCYARSRWGWKKGRRSRRGGRGKKGRMGRMRYRWDWCWGP
jgi:hypothetical protein